MAFYELQKPERADLVFKISTHILKGFQTSQLKNTISYFSDDDAYIRKSAYLSVGRIYSAHKNLQPHIIESLNTLLFQEDFKIRQTVITRPEKSASRILKLYNTFLIKDYLTPTTHREMRLLVP